jgi:hypothetical protein
MGDMDMPATTLMARSLAALALLCASAAHAADPLPSWNDGASKQAIEQFVHQVTDKGSSSFVPPAERIATFDNDGTLWSEQPMYFQAFFVFDRIKALAPQHPEWQTQEPYASVLKGDLKGALAGGEPGLVEMAMATHAGMTTEEFNKIVTNWITTAQASQDRQAVHRDGLSADARIAPLPAGQRLQDLCCFRRRR